MTKFLGQRSNDIVVTLFNLESTVTKFLDDNEITIIEFLNSVLPTYLEENDISVTKFLDRSVADFLASNDISVTKFLESDYRAEHYGSPMLGHYGPWTHGHAEPVHSHDSWDEDLSHHPHGTDHPY